MNFGLYYRRLFYVVLLLLYDVELNPGPVRFPCLMCYKPERVLYNQIVIHMIYLYISQDSMMVIPHRMCYCMWQIDG